MAKDHFDDSAAPYFIGGVLALVAAIATILRLRAASNARRDRAAAFRCSCPACRRKRSAFEESSGSLARRLLADAAIIALWLGAAYVLYRGGVFSGAAAATEAPFNPYEVLGLRDGAPLPEVKTAYRQASLKWHPDRHPNDPAATERWIRIAKAYESLTDELVRYNWETYGNPDGPQPIKVGVALPTWLLEAKNSKIVLLLYFVGFIVLVPGSLLFVLFRWGRKGNFDVSRRTMEIFVRAMPPKMTINNFIDLLCVSDECREVVKIRSSDKEDLPHLVQLLPAPSRLVPKGIPPYGIKSIMLLRAHMARLHGEMSPDFRNMLDSLLLATPQLVNSMCMAAQYRANYITLVQILRYGQLLVQASREDRPLFQVPHFDMRRTSICKRRGVATPHDLAVALKDEVRRESLVRELELEPAEAEDVDRFARSVFGWRLKIEAEAHVGDSLLGPKNVLPHTSIATLHIRVSLVPVEAPRTRRGGHGRRSAKRGAKKSAAAAQGAAEAEHALAEGQEEQEQDEEEEVTVEAPAEKQEPIEIPRSVHAPFYPQTRREGWWFVLGSPTKGMLWGLSRGSIPTTPGVETKTEIKFPTPPKMTGRFQLRLNVMSDSYTGRDAVATINLTIVNPEQVPEEPEPEMESDEEEDLEVLDDDLSDEEDEDVQEEEKEEKSTRNRRNKKKKAKKEEEEEVDSDKPQFSSDSSSDDD